MPFLQPQILFRKTVKVMSLSSVLAGSQVSELDPRGLTISLWSGSIGSTATRSAFWPGFTGTHVVPHLHKRFSSPPDQPVSISDVPSVRQAHQCPFKRCPIWENPLHFSRFTFVRLDPGKENSHSKEGSAKMSCVVQQSPSKNKPCGIYGDEGFQSLQRERTGNLMHVVLHKNDPTVANVRTHTYTHGTDFMHRFTSLACSNNTLSQTMSTCATRAHAQPLSRSQLLFHLHFQQRR